MHTLTVTLADLEGLPHGTTATRTSVEVTARYSREVVLTDGTIIPPVIKRAAVPGDGVASFEVFESDSPEVDPDYQGFAIEVTATVMFGHYKGGTFRRTVQVTTASANPVALGSLSSTQGVPAKWTSIEALMGELTTTVAAEVNDPTSAAHQAVQDASAGVAVTAVEAELADPSSPSRQAIETVASGYSADMLAAAEAAQTSAEAATDTAAVAATRAENAEGVALAPAAEVIADTFSNDTTAAVQRGGVLTPVTIDHAGLQAALNSAATFGLRVQAAGEYTTDQTLTIRADCDLTGLTVTYTGTGTAVVAGSPSGSALIRRLLRLPIVKYANKPTTGWTAGTVGVTLQNLNACEVHVPEVRDFDTNLLCLGAGQGLVHSTIHLGIMWNGRVNQRLQRINGGWVNQNLFLNGRFAQVAAEGTALTNARQILIDAGYDFNGNTWQGTSVEGLVSQYMIEVLAGSYNLFSNIRWESPPPGVPTVHWGPEASNNMIIGGFHTDQLVVTDTSVSTSNIIIAPNRMEMIGTSTDGLLRLSNTLGSTNPIITLYEQGNLTNWRWKFTAGEMLARGSNAHTHPTVRIDPLLGRFYFGTGVSAATAYFGRLGSALALDGAPLFFGTDATHDIGTSTNYRPRDVNASRYVRVGGLTLRDNGGVLEVQVGGVWRVVNLT